MTENVAEMAVLNKENAADGRSGESHNSHPIKGESQGTPGKNKTIMILVSILLAYSVIVSTIALIMASLSSTTTTTTSCDCTVNSLASKTELTDSSLVASGFCALIDFCSTKDESYEPSLQPTNNTLQPTNIPLQIPSANPSNSPSKYPSKNPTNSPSNDLSQNPSNSPSKYPSINPTNSPSNDPSQNPSSSPSKYPSINPSNSPSNDPSQIPSSSPSKFPTYFDGYFIGDYKFSLKNSDHGFWKICNGDHLENDGIYAQLFMEIGYSFGRYTDPVSNQSYFQLPNVTDSIVGSVGSNHLIGDFVGSETTILTINEMPSHDHILTSPDTDCVGGLLYMAGQCSIDSSYLLGSSGGYPEWFHSSLTGSGNSFSLIQPTVFIGNLFIYTGVPL